MLQDVYFVAKIGADTAENEQHFAENEQHFAETMAAREWYLDDLRREIAALRKLQRDGDANLVRSTARQALIVPTLPNVRKCCQILASSIRFTNSTSFITSPLAKSQ